MKQALIAINDAKTPHQAESVVQVINQHLKRNRDVKVLFMTNDMKEAFAKAFLNADFAAKSKLRIDLFELTNTNRISMIHLAEKAKQWKISDSNILTLNNSAKSRREKAKKMFLLD